MSARLLLRLAIIIVPIGVGLIITAWGLTEFYEVTVIITPKTPPPYGVLAFSSIDCEILDLNIFMEGIYVKDNVINVVHFIFSMSVASLLGEEVSSDEQIFGFQIPYQVDLQRIEAKGWSELKAESVPIDIVYNTVHMEGNLSIVYFEFLPLPEIGNYEFRVTFTWMDNIIQQTFSTYSISIPISNTDANIFSEYLSNLNYTVHLPEFSGGLNVGIHLPADCEVREAIPPITDEEMHGTRRVLVWSIRIEQWVGGVIPQHDPDPDGCGKSKVVRITFESREELDRHDRLLFDSGLWLGIGVSNIISGFYAALRYIPEMLRRKQK